VIMWVATEIEFATAVDAAAIDIAPAAGVSAVDGKNAVIDLVTSL
jgi:hypothetical protein